MRHDIPPLAEVRRITEKKRDAWWTVLLVDPVATPLVRVLAMRTRVTPNQVTWGAFLLGLVSAACFAWGDGWRWLVAGAVVYHLSFILDCVDGKLARLTGQGSIFGAWLDFVFDRIRVMVCAIALMAGQYQRTGDTAYIWLAVVVVFLDAMRYINALETFKTRHTMRQQIKDRLREARQAEDAAGVAFMEDLLLDNPEADIEQDLRKAAESQTSAEPAQPAEGSESHEGTVRTEGTARTEGEIGATGEVDETGLPKQPEAEVIDLHQEFRHRFPTYLHLRTFLTRRRIRPHLISGIEFQMGVFIVGPLLDQVIAATVVSGALLLVFEFAIIYKFLLSTREFARTLDSFERDGHRDGVITAA